MSKQETILIADDAEINRAILRNLFESEYNLLEAENGAQTLMLLRQYSESVTAVLLDLVMPEKDGYEVLEEMQARELLYHVPVIVITADDSADSKMRVFELGASDIIAKPFEPNVVKSRVKNIIELGRYRRRLETLVQEQSARERESNAAVIDMLSSVIEYRSLETGQHIHRIRMFTKILLEDVAKNCQEYNLDARKIQLIAEASSLHDIGKIAIPDSILNKPGRLTPEEFDVMKSHTVKGCEILSGLDRLQDREYLQYAYRICRYHHERWDGKGYPDGLKENSIPICAQVVAIADCYDALTTHRVYKKAVLPSQAFSMILNGECGIFSPRLLECFKNVRDAFAQLSAEYADGMPVKPVRADVPLPNDTLWDRADNTVEQSQLKYFALLRYLDSTVMEVDLDSGVYHLVYLGDPDFEALRSGSTFETSIRAFADTVVHPDDRHEMLMLLDQYIRELFAEGLTQRERRYRVLDRKTDTYVWCRAAVLRVNLENPRRHRLLLVWRKEPMQEGAPAISQACSVALQRNSAVDQLLGGVQKCRNDQYFTILEATRSFMDLVGYTKQEIEEQFHNRYVELIHPADRKKVADQFREQYNAGKVLELVYRLITKDNRVLWVSDRCLVAQENGEEVTYCVLLDITRSRQAEEELRLSLERHNVIMRQSNDIIFEWDVNKDELYLSSTWEKQNGYTPITKNMRTEIPKASHLHPDDMPEFMNLVAAVDAGLAYKEVEFRIADAEGKYRWRRVRATTQFDLDGKPFKVVGVILDIDSQKQASAELEDRAARDVLTGLYNKATAQQRVEQALSTCSKTQLCALMVLDVDNFKLINDRYGHMFGDAVLVEISSKLSAMFRAEDTIARIGGDEFLIFMPHLQTQEVAQRRAAQTIETLQDLLRKNLSEIAFSCSIGVAFCVGGACNFQDLFNHSDRALYRAKAAGKNRFMCYRDEMEQGPIGALTDHCQSIRTEIDSDQLEQWSLPYLVVKAFDILYGSADFSQAVNAILALIGQMFHVSRAYIFERVEDGSGCKNTFEWCGVDIAPQIDFLQYVPYVTDGLDYRDNFNADGLFYCQNIESLSSWQRALLEQQNVFAILQYAIQDDGMFYGFVGFDDCNIHRLWTKEQIEALTFVGKLVSVFLQRKRAQEALDKTLANLHSVLDHQEVWLYVIDPDTYKLRYINEKTKQLVPQAQPGRACYDVFYHRDAPCENCVLQQARQTGHSTDELYNPHLNVWVLADAAMVEWDKQKLGLVSCRDISPYKAPKQ